MKIYTSYFSNIKNLNVVPISISGNPPKGYSGLEYKKLAPKYSFFKIWKETGDNNYYIRHFNQDVLDKLDANIVYKELEELSEGKDIALICYEKPEDFCHRHLVNEWLQKNNIVTEGEVK